MCSNILNQTNACFKGTKCELKKLSMTLESLLEAMSDRLFKTKEPFLLHLLKKKLGRLNRKYLRENLTDGDVIIYTDYSKGIMIALIFSLSCFSFLRVGA